MTGLAAWLLERITEDEAAARSCADVYPPPWEASDRGWVAYVKADAPHFREVARLEQHHIAREDQPEWLGDAVAHIARWDPARVLAECEAKRGLLRHLWVVGVGSHIRLDHCDRCQVIRYFGAAYAAHPDYREEWRP